MHTRIHRQTHPDTCAHTHPVCVAAPAHTKYRDAPQSTWLLSLAGVELPYPKEFDDPNLTCTNLLNAIKKLGFASPSYHPTKLTVGYGKEVCGVVEGLVDYVLEKRIFQYKRPQYTQDG